MTTRNAGRRVLCALALLSLAAPAMASRIGAITFDFESVPATSFAPDTLPGALTLLEIVEDGLTLSVTRQGPDSMNRFDVRDLDSQPGEFPPGWESRALDPFFDFGADDFMVLSFSDGLVSVSAEMTDLGADVDNIVFQAWSGPDGTGDLLGSLNANWGSNASPLFASIEFNSFETPIRSVVLRGGSPKDPIAPNSMFIDNIRTQVIPEPTSLFLLAAGGIALLRRRLAG